MSEQVEKVFLLGNSLNLLEDAGKSWEALVENFENGIEGNELDPSVKRNQIPFVFRMSRCFNTWKTNTETSGGVGGDDTRDAAEYNRREEEAFRKLCEEIGSLRPNAIHVELMKLVGNSQILTTNYDYAIESALGIRCRDVSKREYSRDVIENEFAVFNNLTRRHDRVWHIHGEADVPESIIIDSNAYSKGLAALKTYGNQKLTWLNLFLNSEVYILGLEFRYTESLLWYALQTRLELPPDERKPVIYYHFVRKDDENEELAAKNLEYVLNTYRVDYRRIEVNKMEDGYNYRKAWEKDLFEKLKEDMKGRKDDFPEFRPSWISYNIVTSSTPTSRNPKLCWMNIGLDKLKRFEDTDHWIFDCFVLNKRYVYSVKVKDLRASFTDSMIMNNEPLRYSFYIDYADGILYSSDSTDVPLLTLQRMHDGAEYNARSVRKPAQRN